jgi:hypothetical protein
MKQRFMKDLQVIYDELQFRQASLNKYYELLDEDKGHDRAHVLLTYVKMHWNRCWRKMVVLKMK